MAHPGWRNAVMEEIGRVHMLNTWTLVPRTPDMNVIGSQWLYKTKLKPNGHVEKLKVRLVGKGNHQEEGLDYLETFSPVVRTATIRIVLSVAISKGWNLKQLDVTNAFLHGDLKEPVYMSQPQGFVDKERPDYVCKLTKALYGLKQAPRAWFDTFSGFLIQQGFVCNKSDPSLFIYHRNGKNMVLLLYVDDILLAADDQMLMDNLLSTLNTRFLMKDLGFPKYFLGIEIEQTTEGLFIHQSAYAEDVLHQANMSTCNPMPTPLPTTLDTLQEDLFPEPTYFRSIAGKLQYLTISRPDIQFAVNFVCQRMHEPTVGDFGLLKRIMRYVRGTCSMGIHIRKQADMILSGFCDSDWSGCRETRRSTSGICTLLGSNLISWSAKRQDTVSGSSTEAEYRALTAAAREISWLSYLLRDLGIHQMDPTLLQCDNLSAVYLSANPALHKRSKHFENDWHYIREQVALGHIETQHISAKDQLADIFTKPLPRRQFEELRNKLGVSFLPTPSLRGNMGNRTMGLSATAHQIAKPSGSAHMIQRRETTKQSNGFVYGKEELKRDAKSPSWESLEPHSTTKQDTLRKTTREAPEPDRRNNTRRNLRSHHRSTKAKLRSGSEHQNADSESPQTPTASLILQSRVTSLGSKPPPEQI
uniref:Copia-like LTR-retrotransposon n=1 Tax=Brassica napus TaxID=3708 RepID=A0A068F722_BRANA|nr:copia-like LTR-retrotransposon [Brassica napus]